MSLQRQNPSMLLKEGWLRGLECMHVKENKIDDISHMQHWLKLKTSINHKRNIKIKFGSHHWISDNKNFEIGSHLTIFWQTLFYLYFLVTVIYSVIARTKRMKCENKQKQLSNKFICHPEQQMWCENKSEQGQTHVIIIGRTRYYYSQNKFVCHIEQKKVSEQIRTIVRTKSYYSRNNFMCHLGQIGTKVGTSCYYSPNKILIARTTYYSSEKNLHLIPNNKNIKNERI
jgi:hypothetical protein